MISEFVEYVKQVWKNKPNVSSPLNADRLNHMEAGIENNSKKIKETVTAVNELTEKNNMLQIGSTGAATLTTKSWTQGDGGAHIIIPEDGWYYIESFFSKNSSGNDYSDYLKFQMKLGSNTIASQSMQGLYGMSEMTIQTISRFSRGDKIYLNVHVQEAGLKIDTKMIGIRLQSFN